MIRQFAGLGGYVLLFALLLFIPAGTLHWRAGSLVAAAWCGGVWAFDVLAAESEAPELIRTILLSELALRE
jgi:hypothetical protein